MERVVIVGAGPSGLGTAGALRNRGIEAVVLERSSSVGNSWRNHYDRLHLHTFRDISHLPHRRFAPRVPRYPSRQDVVEYLEDYAQHFQIEPRFGQEVVAAERSHDGWKIRTRDDEIDAQALVIATGYNRIPSVPSWPGLDAFRGTIMHSSEYKNASGFAGKSALVVGAGNSGAEIAIDLVEHGARTGIAIRSPMHVLPRDVLGMVPNPIAGILLAKLPSRLADKLALPTINFHVGDLRPLGLRRPKYGPITQVKKFGKIPLIDIGTIDLIRRGRLRVRPGIESFSDQDVVFTDGTRDTFDLVVFATGYRAGVTSFLPVAERLVNERGYPRFHGEEVPGYRGLYFVGFRNPIIGALNDIRREATRVAASIAERQ